MALGVLNRYGADLPLTPSTPVITLGEGDTPLVRSQRIEAELGVGRLYFKLEGCNPTGSFKDRGMVVAVAKALESGAKAIMCASTGNTSASAAAFGARFGLTTYVLVPKGNIAQGKLSQALVHNARIVLIDGSFDQTLRIVLDLTKKHPIALVNSLNPYRIEGQKTAAFEIVDTLGDAPDYLFIPVGNAGNITAYWKGFNEYYDKKIARSKPRMMGFQAAGAAPIVDGAPVQNPQTVASAIRIGNPASWQGALAAKQESGGVIGKVSDDEILEAYQDLARKEGIFGEPASAASLAGLMKQVQNGVDFKGRTVVCIITGNGLKDQETALRSDVSMMEAAPSLEEVEAVIELGVTQS
ncbi:MAG: threonine synthase [Chloroflexi bacterium]|nr:threonine synthase [Chloroflexota bacterium]